MKTIAIINQKGGVAKSTTALALGDGLVAEGKKVLLVDLDAQGNLTYTLRTEGRFSVADVLLGKAKASEAIQRNTGGNRGVLASSLALGAADVTITQTGKEYRLKEALDTIKADWDVCIIDTPPSLGILTINALTAADGVIIPSQADVFSLMGIRQITDTISTVKKYCNPSLKVFGIILARFSKRAIISRDVATLLNQVANDMGTKLFDTRIRECTAIKEAQAQRISIFDYAPKSNAAIDYKNFVNEVKGVL